MKSSQIQTNFNRMTKIQTLCHMTGLSGKIYDNSVMSAERQDIRKHFSKNAIQTSKLIFKALIKWRTKFLPVWGDSNAPFPKCKHFYLQVVYGMERCTLYPCQWKTILSIYYLFFETVLVLVFGCTCKHIIYE